MEASQVSTFLAIGIGALGTIVSVGALMYQIMRNFKQDINKNFDKNERKFELMEQRLFLLCMSKTLPDILKEEKENNYGKQE